MSMSLRQLQMYYSADPPNNIHSSMCFRVLYAFSSIWKRKIENQHFLFVWHMAYSIRYMTYANEFQRDFQQLFIMFQNDFLTCYLLTQSQPSTNVQVILKRIPKTKFGLYISYINIYIFIYSLTRFNCLL